MRARLHIGKRIVAVLLAAVLLLPALQAGSQRAEAETAAPITHFDYFKAAYPSLSQAGSHVFKTLTYEDFVRLLGSEGNYAVLIGGAWSAETQADIGYINEVAQAYGIQTVYNFDTRLDGRSFELADSANKYAHYYVDLINLYLTNLVTIDPELTVSYTKDGATTSALKVQAPFLFVYNKDNLDGEGNPAPIVAALEKHGADQGPVQTYDSSYFDTQEKIDQYKAQVEAVLSQVPTADYDVLDNWTLIGNAFNQTFWSENPDYAPGGTKGPVTIFTQGVDNYDVFEHVTYDQLIRLLESDGNYVILFGGSWCPNTQANIRFIAEYAAKYNVDKIYFWDTVLNAGIDVASSKHPHSNSELQVRTNNHDYAKLYGDLVSTYLTNIKTQNKLASNPTKITYQNDAGQTVTADRLQVPYLFAYNKNNKDADGTPAPILGHVELMYSWTSSTSNVSPDFVFGNGIADGFNHANLTTALDSLYSRLEVVPTGLQVVPASSAGAQDGRITGVANKALEYKPEEAGDEAYQPATGDAIDHLPVGTYTIRYAAKPGYQGPISGRNSENVTVPIAPAAIPYGAGPAISVTVPAAGEQVQPAPVGLTGVAPTTAANNDGRIVGGAAGLEYKPAGAAEYVPVEGTTITGLAAGTYRVRYAAKPGYSASPSVLVTVPAYVPQPPAGGDGGGDGGPQPPTAPVPAAPAQPGAGSEVEVVTRPGDGNAEIAEASVTAETDESGSALVFVSDQLLTRLADSAKQAEQAGKASAVELKVESAAPADAVQVTLPRALYNELAAGTDAELLISYEGLARIRIDARSIDAIAAAAGEGDISLIATRTELTEEGKQALGDRPVYDFTLFAGTDPITSFGGGEIFVQLPYTLQPGEAAESVIVYYINEEGRLEIVRGRYNAATGTVDFATTHFSSYVIGYREVRFADVPAEAWYDRAVRFLAAREIAGGTDDGRFLPNAALTRGDFIVLLLRAYGIQAAEDGADNFADAGSTYYTGALAAAKRLGIAEGAGDGRFLPERTITRQELFTLLYRALGTLGELPSDTAGGSVDRFRDADQISDYARTAVAALVESGVVSGDGDRLDPRGVTTRAQAAQLLYNLLTKE